MIQNQLCSHQNCRKSRSIVLSNESQRSLKREMRESSALDLWDLISSKGLWCYKTAYLSDSGPFSSFITSLQYKCDPTWDSRDSQRASSPSCRLNKTNIARIFTHHWRLTGPAYNQKPQAVPTLWPDWLWVYFMAAQLLLLLLFYNKQLPTVIDVFIKYSKYIFSKDRNN